MGIHSDWIKAFKSEVPAAFSDACDHRVAAGFIDGQIQLMKSRGVVSWDQFVQYQFVFPLRRLLRERGAAVAVLAFDDYDHVPAAKGMTQAKRAKRAEPVEFHPREQLPALIPEYWDRAILNRNFKTRVIQLVIARLPALLALTESETLIIDYKGPPRVFGGAGRAQGEPLEGLAPLGEADLKFFRYAQRFGSLLAVTTDSDYIPIALIRLEAAAREHEQPPHVIVQRLRVGAENGDAPPGKQQRAGRPVEFVDVNVLQRGLSAVLQRAVPRHGGADGEFWMARLCSLIALFGGTDFSRGMPQIGPKRVWDALHTACEALSSSFDTERGQLDEQRAQELLVARLYGAVFAAHVCGARGVRGVLAALQKSKLSERTKQALPSRDYIDTSVRNANWIVLYWGGDRREESPEFGYRRDGRHVLYADAGR